MTRLHPTAVLGWAMVALSALLLAWLIPSAVVTPRAVRALVLSPVFWPNIVAGLIGLGGGLLLVLHRLRPAPPPEDAARPNPAGEGRIALLAVLMAGYWLLLPPLGMVFASMLAFAAATLLLRSAILTRRRAAAAAALAALLPLALHAFFTHVAGVAIPQAPFLRLP